jgi:hypothetical protein
MSKQRPTSDRLANELLGASAFFRPAPTPVKEDREDNPPPVPSAQPPRTPEAQPSNDVTTSRRQSVTTSPGPSAPLGFDINRPTTSRDSLRLSMDETKALDDLRQTLKWDFDVTVSKNDICRSALHWLLEDFASKGQKSVAVARLKRKQTSR